MNKKKMEELEGMTLADLQGIRTELLNKKGIAKFAKLQNDPMGWDEELQFVEALMIEKGKSN